MFFLFSFNDGGSCNTGVTAGVCGTINNNALQCILHFGSASTIMQLQWRVAYAIFAVDGHSQCSGLIANKPYDSTRSMCNSVVEHDYNDTTHTVNHTPFPILGIMLMLMMILIPLRPYAIIMLVVVILMIMILMKMASGGESHAGNTVVGILRAMATASKQRPGVESFHTVTIFHQRHFYKSMF